MKKQSANQGKLNLNKFTVARLNGFSSTGGEKNSTDSDTTASSILCKALL
jgi:hypothetical protein